MKRYGPVALIILIAAVFLWRVFALGECPFFGDVVDQFMPWKIFTRGELLAGRLPFWNPYHFAGSPFLANMQSAVLYPIDLLLLPFPVARAFGLSLWIHISLAGVFAYLFARSFDVSRPGSLLAGIAYMFNGFFMIHIFAGNILTAYAAAWIPLLLLLGKQVGARTFLTGKNPRLDVVLLWGPPVVALHILCGHPQMAFYSFFFGVVLAVLVAAFGKGRAQGLKGRASRIGIALVVALLLLLFGICLAGAQVVPTAEYAVHSSRGEPLPFDLASQFTFSPDRVIEFLIPEFFGTRFRGASGTIQEQDTFWVPVWRTLLFEGRWAVDWKKWSSVYFGSFAFLLALYGIFGRENQGAAISRFRWPLLALTMLALFLSLGPHTPVFRLFFLLPGFKHFRAPSKFTPYMILPLCVFAGAGLDRALNSFNRAEKRWDFLRYWIPAAAVTLGFGIVMLAFRAKMPLLKNGQTVGAWAAFSSLRAFCFVGLGALILLGLRKRVVTPAIAPVLILALHSGELVWLGSKYLTLGRPDYSRPAAIRDAAEDMGAFRESPSRVMIDADLGPPEAWLIEGLEVVSGYDPMQVGAYAEYIAKAENWESASFRDNLVPMRFDAPEYDLLNVRYVLKRSPPQVGAGSEVRTLGSRAGLWVGARDPYPRAFWLPDDKLSEGKWFSSPIWLDGVSKEFAKEHQVEYRRITPGEIELRVNALQDGHVFLSEIYYPFWRAERIVSSPNGKKVERSPVRRVNHLFRLVPAPMGQYTIRLCYRPYSFILGALVSAVGAGMWVALLVIRLREKPRAKVEEESKE
jgi:hypothetical protein